MRAAEAVEQEVIEHRGVPLLLQRTSSQWVVFLPGQQVLTAPDRESAVASASAWVDTQASRLQPRQMAPAAMPVTIKLREFQASVLFLSALSAHAAGGKKPDFCVADEANFAIGELYSPQLAERARQAAGAQTVREALQARTSAAELIPQRLNLEVDHRGIVRRVTCG